MKCVVNSDGTADKTCVYLAVLNMEPHVNLGVLIMEPHSLIPHFVLWFRTSRVPMPTSHCHTHNSSPKIPLSGDGCATCLVFYSDR
jgi:hypothetical protein